MAGAVSSGVSSGGSRAGPRLLALCAMLGACGGMPFSMVNSILLLRLSRHGVDLVLIGFFAWEALVPTVKFAWAWMIDRWDVPGLSRWRGRRLGWIVLAQTGVVASLAAMALTADDASLPVTALFAVLLAFWETTLEIAADGWRIAVAPVQEEQARLVTANLWGYRGAMVAAASGAALLADRFGWGWAYGAMALVALVPLVVLCLMRGEGDGGGKALSLVAVPAILGLSAAVLAGAGAALLALARMAGVTPHSPVTSVVLAICLLPFLALALAVPRLKRMAADAPLLRSPVLGPYVELFWRHGAGSLVLVLFIATYRLGDVMTLTFSHPEWNERGYGLKAIAMADGVVALAATLAGVALGGWLAARRRIVPALAAGALASALANWAFAWLWHVPLDPLALYVAAGIDQAGHAVAATVFVVFLSMKAHPRMAGAQYAFLSGLALLVPRLISGAAGLVVKSIGYDGFFVLSGALSLGVVLLLPLVARLQEREG